MQTTTIIYIIIAFITALSLALFQYEYKSKISRPLKHVLFLLRFVVLFCIFLLFINPKFDAKSYQNTKPKLVIALDNSESISYLNQKENVIKVSNYLKQSKKLNDNFDIDIYTFAKTLKSLEKVSYNETSTNITKTLKELNEIYTKKVAPVVLVTDGNQTIGSDYSFLGKSLQQPIYPVILGDSTQYSDISIKQVNVNRYVYFKNKFPVEIITNYTGTKSAQTLLTIKQGGSVVYKKRLAFSNLKTSEITTALLTANKVGVKPYRIELSPIDNEKNKKNNIKNFAVEVIDQKTNIALISDIAHPDIGTLKKAIESNEQRSVTILKPKEFVSEAKDYQLAIVYQPNASFKGVFEKLKKQKSNVFTITGIKTDFNFLNKTDLQFSQKITNQSEVYQPILNKNYTNFITDGIDFNDYPPLKSEFGDIQFSVVNAVLLTKKVNGINTKLSLLSTFEVDATKRAVLSGEGIWRWRSHTFVRNGNFKDFDEFINKLIQYLSSNKKRKRLNVDYKSFYNGNEDIKISAQYFNKNFEFSPDASLSIVLNNTEAKTKKEMPMLLGTSSYYIDLDGIPSGNYSFTVINREERVSASGNFKVLEYNVEQQFLNPDINKLKLLAEQSNGKVFYPNELSQIESDLLNNKQYKTVQKEVVKTIELIDWYYLLIVISVSLFLEWFLKKYYGFI